MSDSTEKYSTINKQSEHTCGIVVKAGQSQSLNAIRIVGSHDDNLFSLGLFGSLLFRDRLDGCRDHIFDPASNGVGSSGSLVVEDSALGVKFEGGESLDLVFSSRFLVLGDVDFGNSHVVLCHQVWQFFVLGSQALAMSAPGGIELKHHKVVGFESVSEVTISQD